MVGYGLYQWSKGGKTAVAGFAAWLSVIMAALVTALLLGFSGTTSLSLALPALLGIHALIGIGEALITVAALNFVAKTRPALFKRNAAISGSKWVMAGMAIALLVTLLAPLASPSPDGLEWVAQQQGFIAAAQDAPYQILPDYTLPFLGETAVSTILAGMIGVLLVGGVMALVARTVRRRSAVSEISN
jgi:cobalt/nickel transport system permease protein